MRNNEVRGPGLQKSTSERDWGLDQYSKLLFSENITLDLVGFQNGRFSNVQFFKEYRLFDIVVSRLLIA
jgi:hypothetical protein